MRNAYQGPQPVPRERGPIEPDAPCHLCGGRVVAQLAKAWEPVPGLVRYVCQSCGLDGRHRLPEPEPREQCAAPACTQPVARVFRSKPSLYCSDACKRAVQTARQLVRQRAARQEPARPTHRVVTCAWCGKEETYETPRRGRHREYCSRPCRSKGERQRARERREAA